MKCQHSPNSNANDSFQIVNNYFSTLSVHSLPGFCGKPTEKFLLPTSEVPVSSLLKIT